MRVLLIDNYDSFTFNLVQLVRELGAQVDVVRNDRTTVEAALAAGATHLVVSPGPGRPEDAGVTLPLVRAALGRLPLLGVCLGHQALALTCGGALGRVAPMHGKTSELTHDGRGVFSGQPPRLTVGRYHSLAVVEPGALEVSARADDGTVMAVREPALGAVGLQFHPESLLTPCGAELVRAFLHQDALEVAA